MLRPRNTPRHAPSVSLLVVTVLLAGCFSGGAPSEERTDVPRLLKVPVLLVTIRDPQTESATTVSISGKAVDFSRISAATTTSSSNVQTSTTATSASVEVAAELGYSIAGGLNAGIGVTAKVGASAALEAVDTTTMTAERGAAGFSETEWQTLQEKDLAGTKLVSRIRMTNVGNTPYDDGVREVTVNFEVGSSARTWSLASALQRETCEGKNDQRVVDIGLHRVEVGGHSESAGVCVTMGYDMFMKFITGTALVARIGTVNLGDSNAVLDDARERGVAIDVDVGTPGAQVAERVIRRFVVPADGGSTLQELVATFGTMRLETVGAATVVASVNGAEATLEPDWVPTLDRPHRVWTAHINTAEGNPRPPADGFDLATWRLSPGDRVFLRLDHFVTLPPEAVPRTDLQDLVIVSGREHGAEDTGGPSCFVYAYQFGGFGKVDSFDCDDRHNGLDNVGAGNVFGSKSGRQQMVFTQNRDGGVCQIYGLAAGTFGWLAEPSCAPSTWDAGRMAIGDLGADIGGHKQDEIVIADAATHTCSVYRWNNISQTMDALRRGACGAGITTQLALFSPGEGMPKRLLHRWAYEWQGVCEVLDIADELEAPFTQAFEPSVLSFPCNTWTGPRRMTVGDLNGDGVDELVLATAEGSCRVYDLIEGKENATFGFPCGTAPTFALLAVGKIVPGDLPNIVVCLPAQCRVYPSPAEVPVGDAAAREAWANEYGGVLSDGYTYISIGMGQTLGDKDAVLVGRFR